MSFGVGLNSAILGLNAARFGLQIAGQNIANVNTPGYTRQRALLGSTFPIQSGQGFYIGTGVQVDTVNRILDGRLEARIRTQNGLFGFADTHFRRMSEIEGVLGEPGENGLSGLMNGFFGSIGKLRSSAGSRALRGGMIQSAKTMASGFNLLASRYEDMRSDTFQEIEAHLREVNTFAKTVANLNAQIVTLEATGHKANDLRDRREIAINHLSELMDTQAIERDDGVLDVLAGGYLLVSGSRASDLSATKNPDGTTKITVGSTTTGIQISEGRISALLESEKNRLPGILSKLDLAARTIALEVNRLHTTGINKRGPFTSLASDNPIKDGDNDGKFTDELLVSGDFPFEITNGDLYVTVTNLTTKNIERTRIAINPTSMSLGDLSNAIDAIDHLNANVDPTGRLRISSESGFGFDFSNALDPLPNSSGTFGGTSASLGGNVSGPFNFSTLPASFNIAVDGGPATAITLNSNDFKVPSSVSAIELSQVLNGKFAAVTLNVTAHSVGNNISIKADSSGPSSSLSITDGANTPAATMGIPVGTTANGQTDGVSVTISGEYTGSINGHFRFVAEGNGEIGVTPGLKVGVFDSSGNKIASLNVGQGFSAEDDLLEVTEGVKVTFGHGTISATDGHQFALDVTNDSDTTDVLVALGLNTFFTGSTATDLGVAKRLVDDPDLVAAALSTGATGDSSNLARIEALRSSPFSSLNENTIEGFYADLASDLGFEAKSASDLLVSRDSLLNFLNEQRESISGVNIDEEMVDIVRFQQAFEASSRYIGILSQMTQTLINLGRV